MARARGGYLPAMSTLPNGESLEQVEGLEEARVHERVDEEPDEQRNREDLTDRPDGANRGERDPEPRS